MMETAASKARGASARPVERVKVFCRVRPLLQRERDGWSYEEYCERFGEVSDAHQDSVFNALPAPTPAVETPEGPDDDPATFITEKVRTLNGSSMAALTLQPDGRGVTFQAPSAANGEPRSFHFDASLDQSCGQDSVYERVAAPIVQDVMAGYNGTILAYGQTATGKTYTMVGPEDSLHGAQRGLVPRALEDIFQRAEQTRAQASTSVALSYVQIYCERVYDLLEPETPSTTILLREDTDRGVYIDGVAAVHVASVEDCLGLLQRGNANRAVSGTSMNAHSSRSHAILILRVERKEFTTTSMSDSAPPRPVVRLSNLYLVDLAGSERVKKARVHGRHVSELKSINLSLSALGNCISALSKQSQQPANQTQRHHVPYRDSKLTRLLQSSLGGNAKTALVVTVTPACSEAPETLQTLQFGQRAMQVAVRAHRSALSVLDYRSLYEEMRQALDEEQQRSQRAEATANDEKIRATGAEDQLSKALLRVQHLEFECQAAKTANTRSVTVGRSDSTATGDAERVEQELRQLVARHERDVAQVKAACDQQVETYKRLAQEASQEWHEVEGELAGEKTQVLQALQELKEFKLRYFQLEEDTTERIAELVQEERDRERERDAAHSRVLALEKQLQAMQRKMQEAETARDQLQDQLDTDFVPRATIQQMEALYEGAISKLQARVGSLETKSNSQRKLLVPPDDTRSRGSSNNNNNSSHGNNGPVSNRPLPGVKKAVMPGGSRAVPKVGRLVPGSKAALGHSVASRILR